MNTKTVDEYFKQMQQPPKTVDEYFKQMQQLRDERAGLEPDHCRKCGEETTRTDRLCDMHHQAAVDARRPR